MTKKGVSNRAHVRLSNSNGMPFLGLNCPTESHNPTKTENSETYIVRLAYGLTFPYLNASLQY